jgi:hypothetical protein
MTSKVAVVTQCGMVLGNGRVIWDGRDWPQLRDARIDAIVSRLAGEGWAVSDHRAAAQVAAARLDVEQSVERQRQREMAREGFALLLMGDTAGAEAAVATLSGHLPRAA